MSCVRVIRRCNGPLRPCAHWSQCCTRAHRKITEPVRKIVNAAFKVAGLPADDPHAVGHMLARHAAKSSKTWPELIANARSLGHDDPLTALRSYGQISRDDQRHRITGEND